MLKRKQNSRLMAITEKRKMITKPYFYQVVTAYWYHTTNGNGELAVVNLVTVTLVSMIQRVPMENAYSASQSMSPAIWQASDAAVCAID
mmetsp:Transcript_23064/g.48325  ORF Transcript_23064/g.48325 Transcript_23064/m.48325 type:complete len:89 (+) Transcript_23064:356-622(+)